MRNKRKASAAERGEGNAVIGRLCDNIAGKSVLRKADGGLGGGQRGLVGDNNV